LSQREGGGPNGNFSADSRKQKTRGISREKKKIKSSDTPSMLVRQILKKKRTLEHWLILRRKRGRVADAGKRLLQKKEE